MKSIIACLLVAVLPSLCCGEKKAASFDDITFITEHYPPYNFKSHDRLTGIAIDLLVAAAKVGSLPINEGVVKLYPWSRGYHALQKGPNIVLFSTTRTKERENLFKWAGPIGPIRLVLFSLKKRNIVINSSTLMNNYIIGGVRDDSAVQVAVAEGYSSHKIINQSNWHALVNMVIKERIDLWAVGEMGGLWFLKYNRYPMQDFKKSYVLKEGFLYYAFSKDIDDTLVSALQQAIDKLKVVDTKIGESQYTTILNKYISH